MHAYSRVKRVENTEKRYMNAQYEKEGETENRDQVGLLREQYVLSHFLLRYFRVFTKFPDSVVIRDAVSRRLYALFTLFLLLIPSSIFLHLISSLSLSFGVSFLFCSTDTKSPMLIRVFHYIHIGGGVLRVLLCPRATVVIWRTAGYHPEMRGRNSFRRRCRFGRRRTTFLCIGAMVDITASRAHLL